MNREQKIFSDLKRIGLSEQEKREMQQFALNLISKDREPRRTPSLGRLILYRYAFPVLALLVVVMTSLSAAARNAQPGDFLYPYKTAVNENVRLALAITDGAKASVNTQLAEERLNEAEKMIANNKINVDTSVGIEELQQVKANFEEKTAVAKKYIQKMNSDGDISGAIVASSELETTLQAHQTILSSVASEKKAVPAATTLMDSVSFHGKQIADERQRTENRAKDHIPTLKTSPIPTVSATPNLTSTPELTQTPKQIQDSQFKDDAQNTLEKVQKMVDEITEEKYPLDQNDKSNTAQTLRANLDAIDQLITSGMQAYDYGDYSEAFLIFQQAWRLARGAELFLDAKQNLSF